MGLGKFILKSVVNSAMGGSCHHNKHRRGGGVVSSAVTAAVVSGAATAASMAVQQAMNNRQASRLASNSAAQQNVPQSNPYSDSMIAKFALCYYIAKADGYVSPAEQLEIDSIANELLTSNNISDKTRSEMESIMKLPTISFSQVERYLNKVESQTLISFAIDVDNIANASEGIQPAEAKAIDIFKKYVVNKTGYSFSVEEKVKKPNEVNLKCDCCNGTMELDSSMIKAICPYCGNAKVIDANQISSIVSEIERTKRANGGT